MEIGQMANYISFLEDEVYKTQLLQLVSENKTEYRFRIDSSDNYHLTVSKKCGFDHTWYSGENKTIKRRTLIEPF
tara:strand:+ start:29015 stop:29239 length:225 start_codon:yes stop_codon:yes gene_type:complete